MKSVHKLIGILLAFSMLANAGCSLLERKTARETIGGGITRVENGKLSMDIGENNLAGEADCSITSVENPPALEGVDIHAYEFKIDTEETLLDVMELTIPYDPDAFSGGGAEGSVCAAYYNEETQVWEPVSFTVNESEATVTIYTDHLSVYGCFEVKDENTKKAYAAYAIPALALSSLYKTDIDPNTLVEQAVANGGQPTDDALAVGMDVLGNVLSLGGAATEGMEYALKIAGSNSSLFGMLSQRIGQIGLAVGIAQISYGMYDIYQGNKSAVFPCYANALKTSTSYVGGKIGGNLFGLAFVGVMAIDYSLNRFATEAWQGRKDIYAEAYRLYYESAGVKRSAKDWAAVFLKAQNGVQSASRYELRIDGLVQRYVDQFWADELLIAAYQSEAMQNGFTGGGGLNKTMQEEISKAYKIELYKGVLQEAFKILARKQAMNAEKALLSELNAVREELNKQCTLSFYDSTLSEQKTKSEAAGYGVYVEVADAVTDASDWSTVLNEKGEGEISATLLAFIQAGMPEQVSLYEEDKTPDDGEPVRSIRLEMTDTVTNIDVGAALLSLDELVGSYEGELSIPEVYVSPEYLAQAQAAADSTADSGSLEEQLEGCDLSSIIVAVKELEGQVLPAEAVVKKTGEASGTLNMRVEQEGENSDVLPLPFIYDESSGELNISVVEDDALIEGTLYADGSGELVRIHGRIRADLAEKGAVYMILDADLSKCLPVN